MNANTQPYQVKTQAFEGPLDVLLNLIEERKLEITQVSLAEVTGHFIEYVEREHIPPGIIAEFLAVAARLLLIKTKALLPFLTLSEEEEEELVDLETRLKKFEEGTRLARLLLKKLDQAKKKVELLVKTNVGEAALVPFDDDIPDR